jgi:class 3 adenylate cyclase/tetratricopeptide (TPR) repeat protein
MTCPSCDHPVPFGARFCPSCGRALRALSGEERRVVTVVFADLVGYTAMAEWRDPEQVKNLVDGCFQQLVVDVTAYGGRVDKIVGDALVVLFGAPVAHEDDAERAVRAALRMQATLAAHSAASDAGIRMRIGVNTGEVLVGALRAGGDYTAMGDVVNTAARLQAVAEPGTVLVGPATQAATAAVIRYEPVGLVPARGHEPIDAWVARQVVAPPGERPRRPKAPLVGRDTELALLLEGMRLAVTHHRPFLAVLEGEGGVGKSRLAREAIAQLREAFTPTVLLGRCVPYGEANPWYPMATAVARDLRWGDMAPAELTPARVRQRLAERFAGEPPTDLDALVPGLLGLLGVTTTLEGIDPARARAETTQALLGYLHMAARAGPLVLAVSDLDWADPLVLDGLERALTHLSGLPFTLVITARPGGSPWRPPAGRHNTLLLRLDALDRDAADHMARALLGTEVADGVLAAVLDHSGGNPLFLEELTALVGAAGDLSGLPDTLRGLVAARLDRLEMDERAMIDNAAVLGPSGTWTALVTFGTELGQQPRRSTLAALVDAELFDVDGDRWQFRSESVREVAYQTLTKAARAQRHAGVAMAIEGHREAGDALAERIGYHYGRAAAIVRELGAVNHVPADVDERAAAWLARAASRALDHMVASQAERLATEALEHAAGRAPSDPLRVTLHLVRGRARAEQRATEAARHDAADALAGARQAGDASGVAAARTLVGEIELQAGRLDAAIGALSDAVERCRALGDDRGRGEADRLWGLTCLYQGDFAAAEDHLAEANAVFAAVGDRRGQAWVDQHRAWISFIQGDVDQADARLHQAAATFTDMGDPGGLAWVNGLLAFVRFHQGRPEEAEALAIQAAADADRRGERWGVAMMQALLAQLRLWEGRTEEALVAARAARAAFRSLSDGYGEVQALVPISRALVALGRREEAERAVEEFKALSAPFGMVGYHATIAAGVAVHAGDGGRALQAARVAIDEARVSGALAYDGRVILGLALVQLGEAEGASEAVATAAEERPGHPFALAVSALALAAAGHSARALTDAAAALAAPGITYFDRILALLAAGLAHAALDARADSELALNEAAVVASGTGDVVAQAVVRLAQEHAAAVFAPPSVPRSGGEASLTALASGWETAIRLAAHGGSRPRPAEKVR